MARFRLELPADPRWLHVVRIMTVATAASSLQFDVGELDDLELAVWESVSSVTTTGGVTELTLQVAGRVSDIVCEPEDLDLIEVALDALTQRHHVSREPERYRISVGFAAGGGKLPRR